MTDVVPMMPGTSKSSSPGDDQQAIEREAEDREPLSWLRLEQRTHSEDHASQGKGHPQLQHGDLNTPLDLQAEAHPETGEYQENAQEGQPDRNPAEQAFCEAGIQKGYPALTGQLVVFHP